MSERKNIKRNIRRISNKNIPYYGGSGHGVKRITMLEYETKKKQLKLI